MFLLYCDHFCFACPSHAFSDSFSTFLLPADAFLKAAVSILPEVPRSISVEGKLRSSESFLVDFINSFLATLLVIPVRFITVQRWVYRRRTTPVIAHFCLSSA